MWIKKQSPKKLPSFFLKIPYVGPALKEATDATTAPNEAKTTDLEEALKIKEALAQKRTQNAEGDKFQNFELNLDKQYISTDKKDAAFKTFVKNLKKELDTESNFIALKTIEFLNKHDVTLEVYPENATTAQIVQIKKEQNEKLSIDILKGKNLDDAYLCFMYRAALDNPDEIEKKILQDFVDKSFSKEEIKDLELVFNAKEWIELDKDTLTGKVIAYHLNEVQKSDTEVDLNDPRTHKLLTKLIPDSEIFYKNLKTIINKSLDDKDIQILKQIKKLRNTLSTTSLDIYYQNATKEILPTLTSKIIKRYSKGYGLYGRPKFLGTEVNPNDFKWTYSSEGPDTKKLLTNLIYLASKKNENKISANPPQKDYGGYDARQDSSNPKDVIQFNIDNLIRFSNEK